MSWNRSLFISKLKALSTHLALSAMLVGAAFALVLIRWFPAPFYITDGAGQGLRLIVLVVLASGPLLTFVVFNPSKRRALMVLDLGVIGLTQLIAFVAGLYSVHSMRIQAVAYDHGQFQTVTARTYAGQTIAASDWAALGAREPYFVDVREPANGEESAGVLTFDLVGGLAPYELQFLYRPFAPQMAARASAGYTLEELSKADAALAKNAAAWLAHKTMAAPGGVRFFPVQGYIESAVIAFSPAGEWLGGFAGTLKAKPEPEPEARPESKPQPAKPIAPAPAPAATSSG